MSPWFNCTSTCKVKNFPLLCASCSLRKEAHLAVFPFTHHLSPISQLHHNFTLHWSHCLHWAAQRYVLHLTVVWSLTSLCRPQGVSSLDSDPSVLCSQQRFPLQAWIFWQKTIKNVQNTTCQAECVTLNDDLLYECASWFVSYLFKKQLLQKTSTRDLWSITTEVPGRPAVR